MEKVMRKEHAKSNYSIDYEIEDKELAKQYHERYKYNIFKRFMIEHKYEKAVENQLKEDYHKISKRDI